MHWLRFLLVSSPLLTGTTGCAASDADCEQLGSTFVELYRASLSEEARRLDPEVLANAAEAGRMEVVQQCQKEGFSKRSVERCLEAPTLAQFRQC